MPATRATRAAVILFALGLRSAAAQQTTLDGLVAEGLRSNRQIRAAARSVEASQEEVNAAAAARLPTVALSARYSELQGAIPNSGALINPAFGALNRLLGQPAFPTDLNLQFPQKQETSLRIVQPIFSPAIGAGRSLARSALEARVAGHAAELHTVAAGVRLAYLGYLKARSLAALADSTAALVAENVRVNEALVAAGKGTPDAVLRARADQAEVEQRRIEARRMVDDVRRRVNYLLDRPIEGPLEVVADSSLGIGIRGEESAAVLAALGRRPELAQAAAGIGAAEGQLRLARADGLPSLALALDYGIQGNKYRFSTNQDFAIGSVVLSWKLFTGGQVSARKRAAALTIDQRRLDAEQAARGVSLETRNAYAAATTGEQALRVSGARLAAAARSYELVRRKYGEGLATPLELLDARTAFTAAATNSVLTRYDFFERCVELDRAAAWYPIADTLPGNAP